jgi:hypothetical protein
MTTTDSKSIPLDAPIFEAFQWHQEETENASLPGGAVMRFATAARDISQGARTILEIIEIDGLAEEAGERKLFGDYVHGTLLRMAITSLSMLGDESDSIMKWAHERHTPEGRGENKMPRQTATA